MKESTSSPDDQFNGFRMDNRDNPFPAYDRLVDRGGCVQWSHYHNAWVTFGYAECVRVLNSGSADLGGRKLLSFQQMDPPDHTRYRRAAAAAFGRELIERAIAIGRRRADSLTESLAERAEFDLINDFAVPLTLGTICEVLGLDERDSERIDRWAAAYAPMVEMMPILAKLPEDRLAKHPLVRTQDEVTDYLQFFYRKAKCAPPTSTFISSIATSGVENELGEAALLEIASLVLFAGFHTTSKQIGNSAYWLHRFGHCENLPETFSTAAAQECVRYDGSLHVSGRWVTESEMEIGGHRLRAGDMILAVLGAANHDSSVFEEPHVLNLERRGARPLTFGAGRHTCLGAHLALQFVQLAIEALCRQFSRVELMDWQWAPSVVVRGHDRLLARTQLR